jgi:hypothetical protein
MDSLAWLLVAAGQGEITAEKLLEEIQPGRNPDELAAAQKKAGNLQKTFRPHASK